jgi:hypothetical protein
MLRLGEERERALLRVRAGLALVRDDIHRQSLGMRGSLRLCLLCIQIVDIGWQ